MKFDSYEKKDAIVMVIDDDDSVLKTTTLILEDEGYQIKAFSTGKEAIDIFNKNIHAVVLDINMPDLTGLQVFKKIKSINQYVPIIFHTGSSARHEERRDIRRQFRPHAYVQKGDPEHLLDTVVSAVESYGIIHRNVKLSESLYEELKKHLQNLSVLRDEFNASSELDDCEKNIIFEASEQILTQCYEFIKTLPEKFAEQ